MSIEKETRSEAPLVDPQAPTKPLSRSKGDPAYKKTDRLSNDRPPDDLAPNSVDDPPFPTIQKPFIQTAQCSDIGRFRRRNEDACFAFVGQSGGSEALIPFALTVVADGMGGHSNGHEASRKVTDQIISYVLKMVYIPLLEGEPVQKPLQEIMAEAVEIANRAIFNPDPEQEGGTTLTGALIVGRRLYLIHVGDTRAYLIYDEHFEQITTDHSIVRRLQDSGQITADQAATHPHRNLLYRAVTGHELEVDTFTRSLPNTGYLFICSDGLWDTVSDSDMKIIIQNHNLSLQERCEKLVELALDNGSTDNVTGSLVEFRVP